MKALALLLASAAQSPSLPTDLVAQLREERRKLEEQQLALETQRRRLESLEAMVRQTPVLTSWAAVKPERPASPAPARQAATPAAPAPATPPATATGAAPADNAPGQVAAASAPPPAPAASSRVTVGERPPEPTISTAALPPDGGILTRAGQLTLESEVQYTRADDSRVLFRGVQIPASVLVGVFDINENHQDLLTTSLGARLGLSRRLEVTARVPVVYRTERTQVTPVASDSGSGSAQADTLRAKGFGDIEFGARYQLTDSDGSTPYLIAGIQAVAPTGSDPYAQPYDDLGNPLRSATGAGFWSVTPSLTGIVPSDPAVLYGAIGYTFLPARNVGRAIGPALVERIRPGGEPSASLGVALSLNPDLSISLGYAHTMVLGADTWLRVIDTRTGVPGELRRVRSRDLQLGRLLMGISYRVDATTSINWTLEAGQTQDAPDLRVSMRLPFTFGLRP